MQESAPQNNQQPHPPPPPQMTPQLSNFQAYARMNSDLRKADASIKKVIEKIRNKQQQIESLEEFESDPCFFLDNFILEQNGLLNIMKKADLNNLEKQNFKESGLLAELLIDESATAENQISYYLKKRTQAEMKAAMEKESNQEQAEEEIYEEDPEEPEDQITPKKEAGTSDNQDPPTPNPST